MQYLGIILIFFFFVGCSTKEFLILDTNSSQIQELQTYPQDVSFYIQNLHEEKTIATKNFFNRYYKVWIDPYKLSKKEAQWALRVYNKSNKKYYKTNLQLVDKKFFESLAKNCNFTALYNINKKALTINDTNLRVLPTNEMVFGNPNSAGNGFPFDYMQNSLVEANKPLLVSHFSKDKKWAFVQTSYASGWVERKDIAFISSSMVNKILALPKGAVVVDKKPIYNQKGEYLFDVRVGELFPIVEEKKDGYLIIVFTKNNATKVQENKVYIPKSIIKKAPIEFSKQNVTLILRELQKEQYGWGGSFLHRDCSSTIRDFFIPFGIYLPRNSAAQAKIAKVFNLVNLSKKQKRAMILRHGVPFKTLLYRKGHIVLYLGKYKHKIVVFQNVWGVKTKKGKQTGRIVVAKTVYSPLDLGKNTPYYDEKKDLLYLLKSMNVLSF